MSEQSRTALIIGVVVVAVLVLVPVLLMPMMGGMMGLGMMGPGMMGGWGGSVSPWWSVLSLVFGVLVIAGVGLLVVWGVRQLGSEAGNREPSALEILKERYARGELNRDQYEQMRRDLE